MKSFFTLQVVPLGLFELLDGHRSNEYCQRVEPSAIGGSVMAAGILQALNGPLSPVVEESPIHDHTHRI